MDVGGYGVGPAYASIVRGRVRGFTILTALAAALLVISIIRELWWTALGMACLLVAQFLGWRERRRRSLPPSSDATTPSE
jgi:hypothetical protein